VAGGQAQLADDVRLILQAFSVAKKPVLALCAAPLLLGLYARDTGLRGARLTVGAGGEPLAEALNAWGQTHVPCAVDQPCIDPAQRWITVPAYMDAHATPRQIFSAARAGVAALCEVLG
jgi:enhancing lycopene biosynthesis protein 2